MVLPPPTSPSPAAPALAAAAAAAALPSPSSNPGTFAGAPDLPRLHMLLTCSLCPPTPTPSPAPACSAPAPPLLLPVLMPTPHAPSPSGAPCTSCTRCSTRTSRIPPPPSIQHESSSSSSSSSSSLLSSSRFAAAAEHTITLDSSEPSEKARSSPMPPLMLQPDAPAPAAAAGAAVVRNPGWVTRGFGAAATAVDSGGVGRGIRVVGLGRPGPAGVGWSVAAADEVAGEMHAASNPASIPGCTGVVAVAAGATARFGMHALASVASRPAATATPAGSSACSSAATATGILLLSWNIQSCSGSSSSWDRAAGTPRPG